ncbi:MAG: hypothetical protein H7Y32_06250 [Chloroflexales bacterium]|nr:hypothetical protein [Chloroflexales bacterium]
MTTILQQLNDLLTAAVLVIAFSLLAYIALHNPRNAMARAVCVLLIGVVIVCGGDVLLQVAQQPRTISFLLRAQWLGIACVPAGYLHLSDALLTYSDGRRPRWRLALVRAGYALSALIVVAVFASELIAHEPLLSGRLAQLGAGPFFGLYVLFIAASLGCVLAAIVQARRSALTPTLRRRLTYLGATFFAPGLGVFPYLVVAGTADQLSIDAILLLSALVNGAVACMIIVMTYSTAFQGVLLPERLIKYDFVRWGLYGPTVGLTIILFLQVEPLLDRLLGLPPGTLSTFGVMLMAVLMPIFVSRVKPYLDALVHLQDHDEIDYLRALPRSTFTRSDLRQLLENTLIAVCGAIGVQTGFVVGPEPTRDGEADGQPRYTVKALCGSRQEVKRFAAQHRLADLMPRLEGVPTREPDGVPPPEAFVPVNGFCMLSLRDADGAFLGALAVAYPFASLGPDTRRLIGALAHQMELALATVQMQQGLFDALRGLGPEMESLQQLTSRLEQATPASLADLETDVSLMPTFPKLVKDALTHYWGGPKLSDSPLLALRAVRRQIADQGGNPTKALQAVLRQAIDNMRPNDQLDPSAPEWLLYNILDQRFLQGRRISDIANKLALSESDLYRKQRIAVEEVARQIALMEEGEH